MRVICIEGIDAVGKETISKALATRLSEMGYGVHRASFPDYSKPIGMAIRDVLNGACGDPTTLDPELFGSLYTLDRLQYFEKEFCCIDEETVDTIDYLILDRSFYSNFMYQCSKYRTEARENEEPYLVSEVFAKTYNWLVKNAWLEFYQTRLCTAEDIQTFVLKMSEDGAKAQLNNRDQKDAHETNREYLRNCREYVELMTNPHTRVNVVTVLEKCYEKSPTVKSLYNTILTNYLYNVHPLEVNHANSPEGIVKETERVVNSIIDQLVITDTKAENTEPSSTENVSNSYELIANITPQLEYLSGYITASLTDPLFKMYHGLRLRVNPQTITLDIVADELLMKWLGAAATNHVSNVVKNIKRIVDGKISDDLYIYYDSRESKFHVKVLNAK